MTNDPMKNRVIRVPEGQWAAAMKRAGEAGESLSEAIRGFLDAYAAGVTRELERSALLAKKSAAATEAVSEWLIERDWPDLDPRMLSRRQEYRRQAAALLAGEEWAIKKTWAHLRIAP